MRPPPAPPKKKENAKFPLAVLRSIYTAQFFPKITRFRGIVYLGPEGNIVVFHVVYYNIYFCVFDNFF